MQISYIVWAVTAGLCIGAVYTYFIKKVCGAFVKALTDNACIGKANAKSCEEMGIKPVNSYLKKQLAAGGGMSRMVISENDKYYIPEEYATLVQKKYRDDATPLPVLLGILVVFAAVGGVAGYYLPTLIDSLGDLF